MALARPWVVLLLAVSLCGGCARRATRPQSGPVRGVWHRVERGETVSGLAERYGVPQSDIVEINGVVDGKILAGSDLFIPGTARKRGGDAAATPRPPMATAKATPRRPRTMMRWPVRGGGRVSSNYGRRWGRQHEGIDIAAPEGTHILAAADGRVIYSGVMRGYGNVVILEHEDRWVTVYAHNQKNVVSEGDSVRAGDTVAHVGQTGRSTGPHLHFEVRRGVVPVDPTPFLEKP